MLKKIVQILFSVTALVLSGVIIFTTLQTGCQKGVYFSIGDIPEQFNVSEGEVIAIAEQAAAVWNDAAGEEVIVYDEEAVFAINFIFDERQQETLVRKQIEGGLNNNRATIDRFFTELDQKRDQYQLLEASYRNNRADYQSARQQYNESVTAANEGQGSAEGLETRRQALQQQYQSLEAERQELNNLAAEINQIAREVNEDVSELNEDIADFNDQFQNDESTFEQGIYDGVGIEVYQYEDSADLLALLVHEFGHALGMDHVNDPTAVMYYLQHDAQAAMVNLTSADLVELDRVCNSSLVTFSRFQNLWENLAT